MLSKPTLLVLAAGLGSRYGGLKQFDPIGPGGETIIDYSVYDALRAGFGKLVFVIRKDVEAQFTKVVGARFNKYVAVEYVFQELDKLPPRFSVPVGRVKPWGTTHAILAAAQVIREPFAVINADDFYGLKGYQLLAAHLLSGAPDYTMIAFILRNTLSDFGSVARGVCQVNSNRYLEAVTELTNIERDGAGAKNVNVEGQVTRLTGDELVSMNMWGFTPRVFEWLKKSFQQFLELHGLDLKAESYIPSAVSELVATGYARVKVLCTNDLWFGITYRQDRPQLVQNILKLIQQAQYPKKLWQ